MANVASTSKTRAVSAAGEGGLPEALQNLAVGLLKFTEALNAELLAQQNLQGAVAAPSERELKRTDGFERSRHAPRRAAVPVPQPRGEVRGGPAPSVVTDAPLGREVTLKYGEHAKQLSPANELRVKRLLDQAGVDHAFITSTSRTADDQARAMLHNIQKKGLESQYALYGAVGDKVIHVAEVMLAEGASEAEIIKAMAHKIGVEGPSKVSRHCAADGQLVVDISPRSVSHQKAFVAVVEQAQREGAVSNFYHPGNSTDPAFHIEFPSQ